MFSYPLREILGDPVVLGEVRVQQSAVARVHHGDAELHHVLLAVLLDLVHTLRYLATQSAMFISVGRLNIYLFFLYLYKILKSNHRNVHLNKLDLVDKIYMDKLVLNVNNINNLT